MRRLTFPRILIVFYALPLPSPLPCSSTFGTGRNLPIREIILALTFLFLLLYASTFFFLPNPQLNCPRNKHPHPPHQSTPWLAGAARPAGNSGLFYRRRLSVFCFSGSLIFRLFL